MKATKKLPVVEYFTYDQVLGNELFKLIARQENDHIVFTTTNNLNEMIFKKDQVLVYIEEQWTTFNATDFFEKYEPANQVVWYDWPSITQPNWDGTYPVYCGDTAITTSSILGTPNYENTISKGEE